MFEKQINLKIEIDNFNEYAKPKKQIKTKTK